jgi:hypothetical protein
MSLDLAPPSKQQFPTYGDLLSSVQAHAKVHGYAIAVGRSKRNKKGDMKLYYLQCVKSGKACDRVSDHRKPLISQKTECPFRCRAQHSDGVWGLKIDEPSHNHEPEEPIFHHQHRSFPEHAKALVASMSRAGITPKQIASVVSQSFPEQLWKMQDIYNI